MVNNTAINMGSLTKALLLLASLARLSAAHPAKSQGPARTYEACQKLDKHSPLTGCPRNTIFVSKDDSHASFSSVQDAIASLPHDESSHTILIAPGLYYEQLNVTRPGPLTLLGMTDLPYHDELYADVSYTEKHRNKVTIRYDLANVGNTGLSDNVYTGVLTVGPTLNATLTGSGPTGFAVPDDTPFGCKDFRAYNIDFVNNYVPYADGPAHAVGVSRTNAGFYSCGLYSYQDTLYVGKLGNAYFYDTIVAGEVDFLYGFGTAWLEKSTLLLRGCGGGITAWKGANTTFENKYGVYISDSTILASNTTILDTITGTCALGRPWNSQHRSIFMNTYFDPSILPEGYIAWGTNWSPIYTFMAVYDDYGPGWNKTAEKANNLTIVLDKKAVSPYDSPSDVFLTENGKPHNVGWIDRSVLRR